MGGFGGGALKITATGTFTVAGTLSSNGLTGLSSVDGAGAGGSLWLIVGTLGGSGTISANGGTSSSGGGGGGGRIFIQYTTNNFVGTAQAAAGTGGSPAPTTGTVLFSGPSGGVECMTATTITLSSTDFSSGGIISIKNGCKVTINGDIYPTSVAVDGTGSVLTQNGHLLVTANIDVTSAGTIIMGRNSIMNTGYTVSAGSITIGSGAFMNATGMGYAAGASGAGAATGGNAGGGGGNGGRGANSTGGVIGTGGPAYSTVYQATTWGFSGGTGYSGVGGAGGGAITFIVPGTFTVNGTLAVNGSVGLATGGGGGAGGSLWITTGTIAGTGAITANGANGNGTGGGGGGGYVYVFYNTANTYTTANAVASRGTGGNTGATISTAGVVLFTTAGSTATKLVYLGQPSATVRKNAVLVTQPMLVSQDASNNIVATFSGPVTLAAYTDAACTTAAGGTLAQNMSAVNGVILYNGVSYNSTGVIYIKATSGSLTSACSTQVKVGGEVATQLVFTTQPPATATAGVDFVPQPVISAQDANGNNDILTGVSGINPYSDASCTTPATGSLSGTGFANDGVTTFSGADYTKAETVYLKASQLVEGNWIYGCSSAIVVSPAAVSKLAYTPDPSSSAQAGVNFAIQPGVTAQDAYGNTVPTYSTNIVLAAFTNAACTTAASGTLTGGGTYTPSSGAITASGMSYDLVGTVYIGATSGALTKVCDAVTITAGPAAKLVFTVQPANTGVKGVNLRNAQAAIGSQDQYGNTVAFTNTPTVKVYTDATCLSEAASTPVFTGGTTGSGVNRVYTFTKFRFGQVGTYYVGASYGALTLACSSAVALVNNPPLFFRGY
jgi:hypothetical protein